MDDGGIVDGQCRDNHPTDNRNGCADWRSRFVLYRRTVVAPFLSLTNNVECIPAEHRKAGRFRLRA